jgi:hypothetical protein
MRKSLAITIAVLGAAVLVALTGLLYNESLDGRPWLVGAVVVFVGAAMIALGLLVSTNTRRPRGVDPDVEPNPSRNGIILNDGRPYGRRERDDPSVVDRLSAILEEEAAKRPGPAKTPDWARGLAHSSGQIEIADELPSEDRDG